MNDLYLWLEILNRDIENGFFFDALGDIEQVKVCLADVLKSAIDKFAEGGQAS